MQNHSEHLRSKIADYELYEKKFKTSTLLNPGIIGGNISVMLDFLEKLWYIHKTYNNNNTSAYTGDMGAFNYLVRTQFNNHSIYGSPVNTVFKSYQNNRTDCWFRHK
jgi:hypothetical protein